MIKDSGNRTEFDTGAVRDMQKGKGRCDLLPLDVVSKLILTNGNFDTTIASIFCFKETGDITYLYTALDEFIKLKGWDKPTMLLEVSIHFEEGAEKYGENNWQKGLPVESYINSGVRHYLKWLRGDDDERHDRAFCWNIICGIWTVVHSKDKEGNA